jgi:hypothetical protein
MRKFWIPAFAGMTFLEVALRSKEFRPQGGALRPKFSKLKTKIPIQVRDDKTQEEDPFVMLKLFQHLTKAFLLLAGTSFVIPSLLGAGRHSVGFSDALLAKVKIKKAERGRR